MFQVVASTLILTSKGYKPIYSLYGRLVYVYTGYKFMRVCIEKVHEKYPVLYQVWMGNGHNIIASPNHTWTCFNTTLRKLCDIPSSNLKNAAHLVKYEPVVLRGNKDYPDAYTDGYFYARGSYQEDQPILTVKDSNIRKRLCLGEDLGDDVFAMSSEYEWDHFESLPQKYYSSFPLASVESRIAFVAGFLDGSETQFRKNAFHYKYLKVHANTDSATIEEVQKILEITGCYSKVFNIWRFLLIPIEAIYKLQETMGLVLSTKTIPKSTQNTKVHTRVMRIHHIEDCKETLYTIRPVEPLVHEFCVTANGVPTGKVY